MRRGRSGRLGYFGRADRPRSTDPGDAPIFVKTSGARSERQRANQSRATQQVRAGSYEARRRAFRAMVPSGEPAGRAKASPEGRQIAEEPGPPLGELTQARGRCLKTSRAT